MDDLPQNDAHQEDENPSDVQPSEERRIDESPGDAPILIEAEETPAVEPEAERDFEDLTMAQAVGLLWRAPMATLRALAAVARTPTFAQQRQAERSAFARPTPPPVATPQLDAPMTYAYAYPAVATPGRAAETPIPVANQDANEFPVRTLLVVAQFLLRAFAVALAGWGGVMMFASGLRTEQEGLDVGAPYLLVAFVLWLLSEFIPLLDPPEVEQKKPPQARRRDATLVLTTSRLIALGGAIVTVGLTWWLNDQNKFTMLGVVAWLTSIVLTVWALAPEGWTPVGGVEYAWYWLRTRRIRLNWTLAALLAIMLVGTYFRVVDLDATPPEMTSDHKEKLLDVNRVLHGETNIFFANNHGRDAIQFYALALLSYVPGMELDFTLLKTLTVLEGLITLPVLFWMGREVIGKQEPRLGTVVGLLLAALVAVSYWHEMLSRLGLRIVLTPLFTALVIIFLARAVRNNRRSDFLWAGLALGFGVYAYQAIRMLPLVVLFAVGITLIFWLRSMRERGHMLMNLAALVLVSVVIFVPLLHYSFEYPEDFWRRTSGRLFGDEITQTTDENGNLIMRTPTIQERVSEFNKNIPALLDNLRNATLMYNWKGDVAWINNYPNQPAMDIVAGGLLIVGVAAWIGRMIRRRDPFDWSLLPLIGIMMLPSALSIAFPIENPSATRMSGTLPGVYLLAALPLALLALALHRLIGRVGAVLAVAGAAAALAVSFSLNAQTYFQDYRATYIANSLPYSVGGQVLREFAATNGYGNVFILAYPYWWDHRVLGIDAGRIDWDNSILTLEDIPQFLKEAQGRHNDLTLNLLNDMLFFFSPNDTQAQQWLQANFPQGFWQNVTTYQPGHSFSLYRVPALGPTGFMQFLAKYGLSPAQP